MTVTINKPTQVQPKRSTLKIVDTTDKKPPVTFKTEFYEAQHGKAPTANKKGTWTIHPPHHLGNRPLEFCDMKWGDAKKQTVEWIGERPAYGEFVLAP